jgi:hypothetical protein
MIITVLAATLLAIGCGGDGANVTVNTAANTSNKTNAAPDNSVLAVTTPTPAATTNNAPTLTPMFKAYCLAMEKKDEAGIRKAYSKDTLEQFAADMKETGEKTLVEFLSTDNVTSALCEIRNEVINGNEAVAELKTAAIPNGAPLVFVKEGNDWKLTNRSPALDGVKQTASQPAAANKPAENKAK